MSEYITDGIMEVIKKNLPEQFATEMAKFISDGKELKKENESLRELLNKERDITKQYKDKMSCLESKIQSQTTTKDEIKKLEALQKEVNQKTNDLKYAIQDKELEMLRSNTQEITRLVEKVFGHPSVTITKGGDVMTPVNSANGCQGFAQRDFVTTCETTTKSKI